VALPSFTMPSTKQRSVSDTTTELRLILVGCGLLVMLTCYSTWRFRSRFLPQETIGCQN
jgi:hypothetical protein